PPPSAGRRVRGRRPGPGRRPGCLAGGRALGSLALRTSQTRAAVERQQATAQQLAELRAGREGRGAEAAAAAYQEAALLYRDPHLFALALWHGQRAQSLAFGHLLEAAAHELDGAILAEDAAGQITYIRALALFEELLAAQPPEPWRER